MTRAVIVHGTSKKKGKKRKEKNWKPKSGPAKAGLLRLCSPASPCCYASAVCSPASLLVEQQQLQTNIFLYCQSICHRLKRSTDTFFCRSPFCFLHEYGQGVVLYDSLNMGDFTTSLPDPLEAGWKRSAHTKEDAVEFPLRHPASSWPKRSVRSHTKIGHRFGGFIFALKNLFTRTKFNVFAPSSYNTSFWNFRNAITCHETRQLPLRNSSTPIRSWMKTQRRKSGVFRGCHMETEENSGRLGQDTENYLWCDRYNSGRPCEKFYGCTKCKEARGTPELATSQLGGRPYPAADLTNSMDVQNIIRRREASQICRACNWRRFLTLLTGKSSHPRHILLGGKTIMSFYLSGS